MYFNGKYTVYLIVKELLIFLRHLNDDDDGDDGYSC